MQYAGVGCINVNNNNYQKEPEKESVKEPVNDESGIDLD